MKLTQKNVDKILQDILNEEIDKKVSLVVEKLHGNQDVLDVAEPKGILNKKDFLKLHKMKKKETKEESNVCEQCGGEMSEGECMECGFAEGMEMNEYDGMEGDVEEGNLFSGNRADAIEKGEKTFRVGGKTYPVKEAEEKWIQKTKMKKGALHKKLGIPEDQTIPVSKLNKIKKELQAKAKGDKKLSSEDSKLLKQVNMALNLKSLKENTNLQLTESELIDLVENVVVEQEKKKKTEIKVSKVVNKLKDNINKKHASGLEKTEKVIRTSKKQNDDYIDSVTKKMKEYLKSGSDGEFETNPYDFPMGNGQRKKNDIKGYSTSDAVDEYIEAFSYPGQTNLVFDEIKPEDEKIEKYLKGSSQTGNAELDEDGKPLGNVVPSKTGQKFLDNYKDNLYGVEQRGASYKRYPQETIEVAGEKRNKGSLKKSQDIFNKLGESIEKSDLKIINEMDKIKKLYSYNQKTQ